MGSRANGVTCRSIKLWLTDHGVLRTEIEGEYIAVVIDLRRWKISKWIETGLTTVKRPELSIRFRESVPRTCSPEWREVQVRLRKDRQAVVLQISLLASVEYLQRLAAMSGGQRAPRPWLWADAKSLESQCPPRPLSQCVDNVGRGTAAFVLDSSHTCLRAPNTPWGSLSPLWVQSWTDTCPTGGTSMLVLDRCIQTHYGWWLDILEWLFLWKMENQKPHRRKDLKDVEEVIFITFLLIASWLRQKANKLLAMGVFYCKYQQMELQFQLLFQMCPVSQSKSKTSLIPGKQLRNWSVVLSPAVSSC